MAKKVIVDENKKDPSFYCKELEEGNILYFPSLPLFFPQEERDFLLKQKQGETKSRKNIAYKPQADRITNHNACDEESESHLKEVLRNYSARVVHFLTELLQPYAKEWTVDYTSFRPFQEKERPLRLRARNDLLHVDAFPTRPLQGKRILRFFTNINPITSRNWVTSDPFHTLVQTYAGKEVPFHSSLKDLLIYGVQQIFKSVGIKSSLRSPYDTFMLKLHHFLKESHDFQKNCSKTYWEFPPLCCWAVFTDQVSHAAVSGQYALEQTFLVPISSLLFPEKSPLKILERLSGRKMVYSSH